MKIDVANTMADATATMSDGAFHQAGSVLSLAKNIVREDIQKKTASDIQRIISKLRSDERLSFEEISLVKTWIIGDAIGYTKMENNFEEWISEYKRLQHSLADYEKKECSSEDLLILSGLLEDAIRITYDITNYLEKKDRIQKFDSAARDGIDKKERETLANALTRKLQSSTY